MNNSEIILAKAVTPRLWRGNGGEVLKAEFIGSRGAKSVWAAPFCRDEVDLPQRWDVPK